MLYSYERMMAKEQMRDIVPPDDQNESTDRPRIDRGIRNVNIPQRRPSSAPVRLPQAPRRPGKSRRWTYVLAGLPIIALLLLLILFVFRSTSVSVVPQAQIVTFDASSQFTAYPAGTSTSDTLSYTLQSTDLTGSQSVPTSGSTQHVETKASGSITVVNNYSTSPVKFVKNTRFSTPGGLIFRAPADVSIPGKVGSKPGQVTITVVADQAGQQYNIGPTARFSIPGLKSSAAEYAAVYGFSTASTTGGFIGDQPGVSPADMQTAVATVRAQLQQQASAFAAAQNSDGAMALAPKIVYTDAPSTPGTGNAIEIHESAHVDVPVLPAASLAAAVASAVAADITPGAVTLVPGTGFGTNYADTSGPWGTNPITFTLVGNAQIVWNVDTAALAQALAGKSQSAFASIIGNFPGVQSAKARIEPFWESNFPSNPKEITVTIEPPAAAK